MEDNRLYRDYYQARQHLNLSELAYEIIENDKAVFLEKPSRQRILNLIVRNYMDSADAAVDNALEKYREELLSQLKTIPDGETKNDCIATLLAAYRDKLLSISTTYPKGHSFKFQLDKANFDAVMDWRDDNCYYEGVPGRLLKAVIEEYARKTEYEREGILLREKIEELQLCIEAQQLVVLTLNGSDHTRHEVRPYSICSDSGCNYHYLVGLTRKAGTTYPERIASYRLSRINTIKRSHLRSGKITVVQAREIEQKIRDNGVQFLLQESETICVRLTERGKKMYDSQAHLRPVFSECRKLPDGSRKYTFDCTQMQAEFYFFKFGSDAEIIEPHSLRELFKSQYTLALEKYE